jgi:hypothetical protein
MQNRVGITHAHASVGDGTRTKTGVIAVSFPSSAFSSAAICRAYSDILPHLSIFRKVG